MVPATLVRCGAPHQGSRYLEGFGDGPGGEFFPSHAELFAFGLRATRHIEDEIVEFCAKRRDGNFFGQSSASIKIDIVFHSPSQIGVCCNFYRRCNRTSINRSKARGEAHNLASASD